MEKTFPTSHAVFRAPEIDSSDQTIDVIYPVGALARLRQFPLISYAHGFAGGSVSVFLFLRCVYVFVCVREYIDTGYLWIRICRN